MLLENRFLEILMIGAAALIIIGPKDLPMVMRRVGQFVGKMRGMAAEFRASFDELARQSELEELRKEVEALRSSHDSALGEIHASLDSPLGGAFDETTPSFMMPLSPPKPTLIAGAEDLATTAAADTPPAQASPAKATRKPRSTATTTSAKAASTASAKAPAKSSLATKVPAKPRAKAAKVAGEGS